MTPQARKHLDKAARFIDRGEAFYHRAVEEILSALADDPKLTYREIGERFDRSDQWVGKLVSWHRKGGENTPYSGEGPQTDRRKATRLLREAPLEEIERMFATLTHDRLEELAASAGNAYFLERRKTKQERIRAVRDHATHQAVGTFTALSIAGHLDQATEELRELVADASLSPTAARRIEEALEAFVHEFEFAQQMIGGDAS